jgi:hypothetical protein
MPNYNQAHAFYAGVDLHARSMFVHILSAKGKTVFEHGRRPVPERDAAKRTIPVLRERSLRTKEGLNNTKPYVVSRRRDRPLCFYSRLRGHYAVRRQARAQHGNRSLPADDMAAITARLSNPGNSCRRAKSASDPPADWGTMSDCPAPCSTQNTSSANGPASVVATSTASRSDHATRQAAPLGGVYVMPTASNETSPTRKPSAAEQTAQPPGRLRNLSPGKAPAAGPVGCSAWILLMSSPVTGRSLSPSKTGSRDCSRS